MEIRQDQKRRRRTCADWMRRNVARRRHRDLASKVVLQLLALLSSALALLPEPGAFRQPKRGNDFRNHRRTPSVDYGLGAHAWARERGIEPFWYAVDRPKPRPSWNRLVKDLKRRSAKDRARILIEERVPADALDWLREVITTEDWIALRVVGHGRSEPEIRVRANMAALRWEIERQAAAAGSAGVTDDAGAAAPPPAPRPRF